ncbi:Lipid A biosynthesis lauroyl acyltransferase [Symmachiella dynata]|uniref:lysophospholipid acyltransferase family protein n=1 Tax=Symmachiella dynata TaxID=2527995 RepID=UPI00118B10AF|nr:lysophospholipid acyltransferase family protein [Symmachiella dynata]QDT46271.1 Lipid A biosynthesis lauroyl acyltransferase [Symmachiella dynata]
MRRRWRYVAEYAVFRTFVGLVDAMPARAAARVAEMAGNAFFRFLPRKLTRYQVARDNLQNAFGEEINDAQADDIIRRMWVHLFRMVVEMIQLRRKLRVENCKQVLRFHQKEEVVQALYSDRPVLFLSGHFGNWEIGISCFGVFGFEMNIVARDLDNPYLDKWFRQFREQTGHHTISKKGGFDKMAVELAAGGTIALLGDQDAGRRGVFVDFFGHPASTHRAIALMALQYDALICVGYSRRLEDRFGDGLPLHYEVGCEEVIDPRTIDADDEVAEITRRYSAALERAIRKSPEQYFWVHRRWKSIPGQKRKRKQQPLKKAG